MTKEELYIQRCFDLAQLGAGSVSPNPMVGAVLVYNDRIIGEGWHGKYGAAHAEVNAVQSVKPEDTHLISQSTLYVSLEPCCIYGRTPPCTDLILQHHISKVVLSCLDKTPGVAGKSVKILRSNGIEVVIGILQEKGEFLSRFRNHFVTHERPYVILKYAQTFNGKFGISNKKYWISNKYTRKLVHKWRNEVDAILIGTNTALIDNPQLTNRLYFGKSPIRIVLDRNLTLPKNLHIFDNQLKTIIVTNSHNVEPATSNIEYWSIPFEQDFLSILLRTLHKQKITTLLVEGGATLLQSFIDQNLWDEARVLIGNQTLDEGVDAPQLSGRLIGRYQLADNQMIRYQNIHIR